MSVRMRDLELDSFIAAAFLRKLCIENEGILCGCLAAGLRPDFQRAPGLFLLASAVFGLNFSVEQNRWLLKLYGIKNVSHLL